MTDIITELEQATGPDRELDARIWCEMKSYKLIEVDRAVISGNPIFGILVKTEVAVRPTATSWFSVWPNYTGSIDAALKLIPDGWNVLIEIRDGETKVILHQTCRPEDHEHITTYGRHDVSAIAICIAALRAIELDKGENK